jgi:anti-sigma factor ChrR (cupin superfamily)
MSGATPNASKHGQLPPLASRFVEVAALPWEKTRFPGVEAKTMLVDRDTGVITSLMKFAPGARLPDRHVLIEPTVLEGSWYAARASASGRFRLATRRHRTGPGARAA